MKAIVINEYGGKEQLQEQEVTKPTPGAGQVLVKQHATSINPIDWKLREGYLKEMVPMEFPLILGWDSAGVVEEVGEGVTDFKVGDRVFTRPQLTNRGTYAEYIVTEADILAHIPENISFNEAASVPLTALTAWQCLFDFADLQEGQKVLIHAGAGGVGVMAIQIAKNAGAYVATTASTKNVEFLQSLGADQVIDYKKENFYDVLEDYDVVLDALGGDIQERSFDVLKDGGTLVSIAQPPSEEKGHEHNVKVGFVFIEPDGNQMRSLAQLMEKGKLKPIVGHTFPFSEQGLKEAHELSETHHAKGKIVIEIE
ncbi:NADP-dependent oxidoreductase [Alkalibacillus haloalkaliphilus]|uniref:Oxidoreductase n=1 Tax=Alkalibacillus haloalkaliphilus TaxID=94136 RepID=A0A511W074_9BACI|nr:NADP-dependent oxidoreductase [Alkalibacillus haloalkaliphilus]GEN44456.1 oxidoreductase [Alkalibacillus haloalkaliphilus]